MAVTSLDHVLSCDDYLPCINSINYLYCLKGDSDGVSPDVCLKKTSSPRPNKIVREPPDGCEKVKAFDEDRFVSVLVFCNNQCKSNYKYD